MNQKKREVSKYPAAGGCRLFLITVLSFLCIVAALAFLGCSLGSDTELEAVSRDLFAMDTHMTLMVYAKNPEEVLDAAEAEIERLDALLSVGDISSEVYNINKNGGGTLSEDTAYLLERSLSMWAETDGCFNIAVYPLMEAWGFTSENYRVPSDSEIKSLLALTDVSKIIYETSSSEASVVFETEGMAIDFGGIAKGYTSARLMEIFEEYGVCGAVVSLGGNVQLYGEKPSSKPWNIAIQDPEKNGYLCALNFDREYISGIYDSSKTDGGTVSGTVCIITSGGYERYFEADGKTYHHIIDPATGYPAESGLVSVSVICSDGTYADALSTSLFVMGLEGAENFWREHGGEFEIILQDESGQIYISEGLAECFTSDYNVEIISAAS